MFSTYNKFNAGVHMNPHPDKLEKGGEDAFSISKDGTLLSVADGVGGWANSGVDPALYSKRLCSIIDDLHKKHENEEKYKGLPRDILIDAVGINNELGSCTVCLANMHKE